MKPTPLPANELLLRAAGVILIVLGILAGWSRVRGSTVEGGVDFAVLHVMGVGIVHGVDVYKLNEPGVSRENVAGVAYPPGMMNTVVYPPVTGFALLPLGLLPFSLAKIVWFGLMNATLVLGVRALVGVASPGSRPHFWMIASGVVLLSAGIRWGMMLLQGAPIVLGLLCFFVAALHTDRPHLAVFIAVLVTAFKVTLALPFLGLLLLHRRFTALFVTVGAWLVLNALGFVRMGGTAFASYWHSATAFEAVSGANINSPNPWEAASLPRLDWVSFFYGLTTHLPFAQIASLACSVLVLLWLVREGLRARPLRDLSTTATFLTPLVCLGSLCVYHHQYDLCLFFAPALLTLFGSPALRKPRWALVLALPLVLMILLLPIGMAGQVAESILGWRGLGLLKLTFPTALTLALAGSMVVLRHNAAEKPNNRELFEMVPAPPGP